MTSADLVSRFFAAWTPAQLASHRRAAEQIATIAREAFARAGTAVRAGEIWRAAVEAYVEPEMDGDVRGELVDFVKRRRHELGDD